MHFISAYMVFFSLSIGFYLAFTKEHFIRPADVFITEDRSDAAYSMQTDYELYDTTHPKYFPFHAWKLYCISFQVTSVLQLAVLLM